MPAGSTASTASLHRANFFFATAIFLTFCFSPSSASGSQTNLEQEVQELRQENAALKQQVQQQGAALEALTKKVGQLEAASPGNEPAAEQNDLPVRGGYNFGKVNLSGEGGVAFFNTGSEGFAPHSEFRVDEARLFADAEIWKDVYFFGEADFATRENDNLNLQVGELYLDFEDVSQLWGRDGQLNIRAGRLNVPFGEEYMTRNVIDNPLISRSLSDLWGFDPGVELYGALGKFNYVVAVQNSSGKNGVQDFDGDKSVAGRISFDPNRWLHFSISGMRTGDVNAQQDFITGEWFATGFFHSLGSPATTTFHVDLVEGDVAVRWNNGYAKAFGGYGRYGDNDPGGNNGRDIFYYSVEGVQNLPAKFFVAARFSQILSDHGINVVGYGNGYFFGPLTTDIWRLSLGGGYRFSDRLILKVEYSLERGNEVGGGTRDNEDFFGTEAAFRF
ncbi:MAG TPA: hypothetical protein VFV23_06435 [Verrucomicrobiae bacterium]|nr:hypothetical protein [Verrucomicrobiae bacterium]